MNCFQLHLAVNQRLQEVASFKRNKYFPEEIDLALNTAMYRLLEKGVENRFQDNQINLSTVSALIQKNTSFPLIIPDTNDYLYEDNTISSYCVIPPDLYWVINSRLEVGINPLLCSTAPAVTTTTLSEYVSILPYPTITGNSPYYGNLKLVSSTLGTIYTIPSEIAAGLSTEAEKFVITQNILESFYNNGEFPTVKVYWERYRNKFYKNNFIVVSSSNLGTVLITANNLVTTPNNSVQTNYSTIDRSSLIESASCKRLISTSRIQNQDSLYEAIYQNTYYASSVEEPLINQTFDYFIVYQDKSFIVSRLYIDHIRKPRTISLSLNQTCELAENTHTKLVDLAVEILKLDTKDSSYSASVQDTELRN